MQYTKVNNIKKNENPEKEETEEVIKENTSIKKPQTHWWENKSEEKYIHGRVHWAETKK